ncbi:hypothetical protein DESC_510047 [Desulfosarcina cetonica]|nr:hypothetical protein DESC_510047 [Desulfosarcina cetonica]
MLNQNSDVSAESQRLLNHEGRIRMVFYRANDSMPGIDIHANHPRHDDLNICFHADRHIDFPTGSGSPFR